jgi:hypothetical protein
MIFWIAPRMQPAPRKLAKGIGNAQPPSALQAIYGYRRVLRDCGRYLADLKKVGDVLRGLNAAFLKLWGQEALAVDHHIPFSLDVVHRMHEALRSYAIVSFSVALHDAICVIMLFSLVRGPRLDEWCRMFKDDTFYRRLNFVWVDGRVIVGSTQAAAARGGPLDGWLLRVQNVPSKTDRTGQRWMGKFMWYVLHVSSPLNFAKQWLAWELAYPCPENLRHAWPAFSPDGGSTPFSQSLARRCLHDLLFFVGGAALALLHAWHDWRATIASALKGANKSDSTVQAIVCWASAASVQLYGQMTPELMAATAELATSTDASRHAHLPTPHIGPESLASEFDACANELSSNGKPKAPTPATSSSHAMKPKAPHSAPARTSSAKPPSAGDTNTTSKAKSATKRGRSPSLSASTSVTPPVRVDSADVGAPYGVVEVDASSMISGETTLVNNAAWGAGSGSTLCTILGTFETLNTATHQTFFVLCSSDDQLSYPFSSSALRQHAHEHMSTRQLKLLPPPSKAVLPPASPSQGKAKRTTPAPRTPSCQPPAPVGTRHSPRLLEKVAKRS